MQRPWQPLAVLVQLKDRLDGYSPTTSDAMAPMCRAAVALLAFSQVKAQICSLQLAPAQLHAIASSFLAFGVIRLLLYVSSPCPPLFS